MNDLLARGERDILEAIARDSDLDHVLDRVCKLAEQLVPGAKAGVTVLDRAGVTFRHCVMPSAPGFAKAIPGATVGLPHVGTCAAAAYHGRPMCSDDVAADERFAQVWRRLNLDHGVRRIQSWPTAGADGRPTGSFYLGFAEAGTGPWPDEIALACTELAGLAIARHRAQERDRMLVREAQHRLKNLFASVMSIASQTAHSVGTLEDFMPAFEGRVRTLAAAHDMLTDDKPADLGNLVRTIVQPFAAADAVEMEGDPFRVAVPAIVPFSLVLHELATNAAKYGALSAPEGRARVSWQTYRDEAGQHRFRFRWQERGGPIVSPPTRSGTGTLLMSHAFDDVEGRIRLDHAVEGLIYELDAPLTDRLGRQTDDLAAAAD